MPTLPSIDAVARELQLCAAMLAESQVSTMHSEVTKGDYNARACERKFTELSTYTEQSEREIGNEKAGCQRV